MTFKSLSGRAPCDNRAFQTKGLFKLHFQCGQACQLAFDGNFYFIASTGISKKANDCDTADAKRFSNVVLGHLFDVIHPRGTRSQPARAVFGGNAFRSNDEVSCLRILLRLLASFFQNNPSNYWRNTAL